MNNKFTIQYKTDQKQLKKTFYKQDTCIENKTMIKCSPLLVLKDM